MNRLKVAIDALRTGMYVAELDRPWTETPFVFQGFVLRTPRQIETLRQYCAYVYVDIERSDCVMDTHIFVGEFTTGTLAVRHESYDGKRLGPLRFAARHSQAFRNESFRRLPARLSSRTTAIGTKMPRRPSYLPPLRTVS